MLILIFCLAVIVLFVVIVLVKVKIVVPSALIIFLISQEGLSLELLLSGFLHGCVNRLLAGVVKVRNRPDYAFAGTQERLFEVVVFAADFSRREVRCLVEHTSLANSDLVVQLTVSGCLVIGGPLFILEEDEWVFRVAAR